MTFYIKAPLSGEVVSLRGKLEKVEGRTNATEVKKADAEYLREQAQGGWRNLNWEIEELPSGKYIVKARQA